MARKKKAASDDQDWKVSHKAKFGWCLTGQHDACIQKSDYGTCGCDCHKK